MADLLNANTLGFFLYYIVPGFVAISTYNLIIPSEKRNFGDAIVELISFSMINLAICFPLIILANQSEIRNNIALFYLASIVIVLLFPIIEAVIWNQLRRWKKLRGKIPHPLPNAWEWVFSQDKSYWVIVHLKNGSKVAGEYSENSFTGSFPNGQDIYLEKLWKLDEKDLFITAINKSGGAIIKADEWSVIELFEG